MYVLLDKESRVCSYSESPHYKFPSDTMTQEEVEAFDFQHDIGEYVWTAEGGFEYKPCKATQIEYYKDLLAKTDYQCLKYADGALTEEEYAATRAQRQEWRDRINELEQQ